MKKISAFLLAVLMSLSLFACGNNGKPKITLKDFDTLLSAQPVVITDTQLLLQTGNKADKRFYPDMLTATFQNRTDKVLTYVQVAFVAWDKDGNPVKIKSVDDEKSYEIKAAQYKNIKLESGRYYGKGMGLELSANHGVATFKAIVVRFETVDGDRWENPYYSDFYDAFVSQKYSASMMLSVEKQGDDFKALTKSELEKTALNEETLTQKLSELSVQVVSAEYVVTGADKDATPDVIKATFKNVGENELSKVVLSFFGFDEKGKAVKIKDAGDNASSGNYTVLVEYSTTDFVKDAVAGANDVYQVHEGCGIKYVIAVVKSYTDADGVVYENPYFIDSCLIYEGGEIEVDIPEIEETVATE